MGEVPVFHGPSVPGQWACPHIMHTQPWQARWPLFWGENLSRDSLTYMTINDHCITTHA